MDTDKKKCIACQEFIQAGARRCRYCGSPQQPARWQTIGIILKWVGGITAVISLLLASFSINELISEWRDERQTVADLVQAADLQETSGNYSHAWSLLDEALGLAPGSPSVRYQRIRLAMRWLRTIPPYNADSNADLVEQLQPPLFIGAVQEDISLRADVLAHIGWANFLLFLTGEPGLVVDKFYQDALQLDPDNPYANAMRGYSLMSWSEGGNSNAQSAAMPLAHFDTALASGEQQDFLNYLLFQSLEDKSYDTFYQLEFMRRYQQLTLQDPERVRRRDYAKNLLRNVFDPDYADTSFQSSMLDEFAPAQLLATWHYVRDPDPGSFDLYVGARLEANNGDPAAARLLLEQAIAGANRGFENYLGLFNDTLDQLPDP